MLSKQLTLIALTQSECLHVYSKEQGKSIKESAVIFQKYKVFEYISSCYAGFTTRNLEEIMDCIYDKIENESDYVAETDVAHIVSRQSTCLQMYSNNTNISLAETTQIFKEYRIFEYLTDFIHGAVEDECYIVQDIEKRIERGIVYVDRFTEANIIPW